MTLYTTLVEAEEVLLDQTNYDQEWKQLFYEVRQEEREYFGENNNIEDFDVKSIAYFNTIERSCNVLRLIKKKYSTKDYFVLSKPLQISMEHALTLDLEQNSLSLYFHDEVTLMDKFRDNLLRDYIRHLEDLEQQQRRSNPKEDVQGLGIHSDMSKSTFTESVKYEPKTRHSMTKKGTNHILNNMGIRKLSFDLNRKEKELVNKKEQLIKKPVDGESYIFSNPDHHWKEIVVDHFFKYYFKKVDINKLIVLISNSGAKFSQSPNLITYPIINFFNVIKKELKIKE